LSRSCAGKAQTFDVQVVRQLSWLEHLKMRVVAAACPDDGGPLSMLFIFREQKFMQSKKIYITEYDAKRLQALFDVARRSQYYGSHDLKNLGAELSRATVVASKDIPHDVITMNSTVRLLDLSTNEEMTYTLVFPEQAEIGEGKISVLAPIGTAMLGYRVGDTISWTVPAGVRKIKILSILYQPEAAGDYHL